MSDREPPSYVTDAPPEAPGGGGAPRGAPAMAARRGNDRRPPAPQASAQDVGDFFEWLNAWQTQQDLKAILPSYLTVEQFIATARDAALNAPALLEPSLRASLLQAIMRAAKQGIRLDGREGALVKRYDTQARGYKIQYQPMVWGIVKLGRLTGSIKSIRGVIVFEGERFEIEEAPVQIYRHVVNRKVVSDAYRALNGGVGDRSGHPVVQTNPEDFFNRIDCAYCIIESEDGTITQRWMPRERIALIRNGQPRGGPWFGAYLDEMVIKTVILFTSKHVDLDITNPATERFRAALEDDTRIDFDRPDDSGISPGNGRALIGHETRLDAFEAAFAPPERDMAVTRGEETPLERREAVPPAGVPTFKGVKEFGAHVRSRLEAMITAGQPTEMAEQAWFKEYWDKAHALDPDGADELRDAIADREGYLRRLSSKA